MAGHAGRASAQFMDDQVAEPDVRRVVIALGMPNHAQDEGRQAQRFRAGDEIEAFAKMLDDRLLNAGDEVAGCDCVQEGETVRQRQSETALQAARGEFVVDQSPELAAVDDRGMVELGEALEGRVCPSTADGRAAQ